MTILSTSGRLFGRVVAFSLLAALDILFFKSDKKKIRKNNAAARRLHEQIV
ncbi:hypothetical protein AWB67_06947 [Caballeronia terrestris]|uniref:Uncharacterized protein n=1 Tax=Caballeronia terrestris TaxID=1226301 RepID=A0A158KWH2_9BURK|nr:hypothetical protein [Caballeronia terrestris]SAL85454.1 hypothetical protein AWB67_06947 [Caballeronia terrestris]